MSLPELEIISAGDESKDLPDTKEEVFYDLNDGHPQKVISDVPVSGDDERRALCYRAEQEGIALQADFDKIVDEMMGLTDTQAVELLLEAIDIHRDDLNFPKPTMKRISQLVQGYKLNDMSESDWSFNVKAEAAMIFFYSPYPEVRAVTDPHDDPAIPCETIRVYCIGVTLLLGSTALNSFFHSRQPSINLGAGVLQLIVWPLGTIWGKIVPDWGFTIRGKRYSFNPGPWTFKEQVLSVIFFDLTTGYSNIYDVFLVQRLPVYLKQDWVNIGYELLLSFSIQFSGFAFAGILRRFAVFPSIALWPSVLPTLALSRALTIPEVKGVKINGWKLTRYRFFAIFSSAMFFWFWVPNFLFQALRGFNWMTWIAPENFNLAAVTGFYGGMGFNPWATFDYNVSGSNALTTPFFAMFQSTIGMAIGGIIILGMSYSNMYWTAFMPPNSNNVYANTGQIYVANNVLGSNGVLDPAKYEKYGPPYYPAYNIFQNGQSYGWVTLVVVYITIRYWRQLSKAFKGVARSFYKPSSVYEGNHDAQVRLYRRYKEVPEWWFMVLLAIGLAMGIAAVECWPTQTPWWALVFTLVLTAICIVPMTFILAIANVSIETTAVLQILSSVMFPGKPQTMLIFAAYGTNNLDQSRTYAADIKMGLYARIPPRALFRVQLLSVVLQTFVFVVMIDWLTTHFSVGTLCTTSNPQHFVCNTATHHYGNAIETGMMGAQVVFKLYPIMPWCFLIGGLIGLGWGLTEKFGPDFKEYIRRRYSERAHARWNMFIFKPIALFGIINPAIFWAGAHNWGGAANLSYYINALYASFIFMYYIKRRYPAWWEKYNYLLQISFDVGVAVSGLVQTLAQNFGPRPISAPKWWGNSVSTAGIDYKIYNSKASVKTVPKGGYFGLPPGQYPKPPT